MNFKRTLLSLTIISSILLSNFLFESTKTDEVEVKGPKFITMDSRKIVSSTSLAPYKTQDRYISKEYSADFNFSSVGISWYEALPVGTKVELAIRFKVDNKWTKWLDTEEEEDFFQDDKNAVKKYALASTNLATAVQYKFAMFGDGKNSPYIKDISTHFIRSGKMINIPEFLRGEYASSISTTSTENLANPIGIIDRETWGANESYRYLSNNSIEPDLIELGDDFYEEFADELIIDRTVEHDENGDKYKWPLQYPEEVKKIIVHHTTGTSNLDNPMQAVRDIYYYHSMSRGWGDIGYNYLIDQQGNIYEGRYGGEGIIAAHAGPANHGSIGIAVLGNYQNEEVPEAVTNALNKLTNIKSKIHNIEADGKSKFRGEYSKNILGHRDVMSTTCPGQYLYDQLPVIRTVAAQINEEKTKFVKAYDFQNHSDLYYVELKPEEAKTITLKFENIGTETWDSPTYLTINKDSNILGLPNKVQINTETKPGEIATFKFTTQASTKSGTDFLKIKLDNVEDAFILPVKVQEAIYDFEVIDADLASSKIKLGNQENISIKVKNTGNVTWKDIILLSDLGAKIEMTEQEVKPGKTANFNFKLQSPDLPTYYTETFTPHIDGVIWNNTENFNIETLFYEKDYELNLTDSMTTKSFRQDKSYTVSLNFRNIGGKNIQSKYLKANFLRHADIDIKNLVVSDENIKTGETFKMSFNVVLDEDAKITKRSLIFTPKYKKEKLLRIPILISYLVLEKLEIPVSTDNNIRVKISFDGEPEISSNSDIEVYTDGKLVAKVTDGSSARVTKEMLAVNNKELGYNESVRFETDGILKIINFENRPAWNPSLNDNTYRGVLEVRKDLTVINELDLEYYLKGLGEVLNADPTEKIKALMIAARTYAKYYIDIDEKFPGKPYHLDDDPNVSQKYLGYGFELRAPNISSAVNATRGKVVTYNGEIVKTPYFSSSDGVATKSAEEVWGWDFTPYLKSVSDTYCNGTYFYGHGVGLSGCGSKGMADSGYGYEEILKHYYTGVEVEDLY